MAVDPEVEVDRSPLVRESEATAEEAGPRKRRARKSENGGNGHAEKARSNGGVRVKQLRRLLAGLRDLRAGDFSVRLSTSDDELLDEISDAFNRVAEMNERMTGVTRPRNTAHSSQRSNHRSARSSFTASRCSQRPWRSSHGRPR